MTIPELIEGLNSLSSEIAALAQENESLRQQIYTLANQVNSFSALPNIEGELRADIQSRDGQIQELQDQVSDVTAERDELQREVDAVKAALTPPAPPQ